MPGVDVTENYIRIRQKDPGLFEKGSFRTISLKPGVRAVIGKLKGKKSTTIQTLLFDKKKFDVTQARAWVKSNVHKYSEEKIIQVKNKMEFSKAVSYLDEIHFAENGRWTREQINNLPDSSFAIILPGGKKDEDGKTVPRSLRKLPYKNAEGNVDLPHLRNALARVNQPGTELTPEQRAKAKATLLKVSKKYLKTYKEKKESEQMADDGKEEFELSKFQEEDIFARLKSIAERLEAAKTIDEVKPIVLELKELTKTEEEEDGEEKEETEQKEEGKEVQEIKTEVPAVEPAESKPVENSQDNSQLSEALKLNEKILTALKESEDETEKLKGEAKVQETKFSEQIQMINKINEKYKSDLDSLSTDVVNFINILNEQKMTKFSERINLVAKDYCNFMNLPESEMANVRQTMSKWSEDMIEQTAKAISTKRTKMTEREPIVLTTTSSQLRETTAFSDREWEVMTAEEKMRHLHSKMLEIEQIKNR